MSKKYFVAITVMALAFCSLSWAQIDKIAIYNENVGWTEVAAAEAATAIIMDSVTSANEVVVLNDADMGVFAEENTDDGNFDMIITFGYFPASLYTPGNEQVDGSLGELFIEGGDMLMNTADYIFYVTEGGAANGDTALKNMTDSEFGLWTDDNVSTPTADGAAYTPSLIEFAAPRSFLAAEIEADPDWEVEIAFGSGTDGTMLDPVIIRNLTYGGRVAIAFQVSDDSMPRGEVFSEMIENYIVGNTTAVDVNGKLPVTWGGLK